MMTAMSDERWEAIQKCEHARIAEHIAVEVAQARSGLRGVAHAFEQQERHEEEHVNPANPCWMPFLP